MALDVSADSTKDPVSNALIAWMAHSLTVGVSGQPPFDRSDMPYGTAWPADANITQSQYDSVRLNMPATRTFQEVTLL